MVTPVEKNRPEEERSISQGTCGTILAEEKHESGAATVARQESLGTVATAMPSPSMSPFIDSPLLPNAPDLEDRLSSNPREDFLLSPSNCGAADLCLEVACSLLRFEVAEVRRDFSPMKPKQGEPGSVYPHCCPNNLSLRSSR